MKYLALSLAAAVLFMALIPKNLEAPPFIHGYVYDASDSTAIDSARVEGKHLTEEAKFSTTTDANGYYAVYDTLPSGWWKVTASHYQYRSKKKEVQLPSAEYINFELQPIE